MAATVVEFDFEAKQERTIPAEQARAACDAGRFCWVDVDADEDRAAAEALLHGLGVNEHAVAEAVGPDEEGRYDVYDDCLHFAVTSASRRGGTLVTSHVDIILGERFLVTLRRGPVDFIDQVRKRYRQDFLKFAKSGSFILFECWDSVIEGYKKARNVLEDEVDRVQSRIFGPSGADDKIFNEVAVATQDLLRFRKSLLAAREVLHELAYRKSPFVAESTQPFLGNMVGTLERIGSDSAVQREILAETLNLYIGITSHRTSRVVSRLTVVSMIFLPLTFLCGVYGMNFDQSDGHRNPLMPELTWDYGYMMFWVLAASIAVGLLSYMKWRKWV